MTEATTSPAQLPHRLRQAVLTWTTGWTAEATVRWLAGQGLLLAADEPQLPKAVRAGLSPLVAATETRNRYLVWRFQDVIEALAPLPVCALKGIVLLDTLYGGRLGSRPMVDLDLLVKPEDEETAVRRLERALGFRETDSSRRLRGRSPHRVLVGEAVKVELHRELSFKHGGATSWADVAPVGETLHDRVVFVLDRETELVHLASHFVRHGPFAHLKWACDVLLAAERGYDRARLEAVARRLGAWRTVEAGGRVLARVLGGPAPIVMRTGGRGAQAAVALNERLVWRQLGRGRVGAADVSSRAGRLASALLLADGWRDAARVAGIKVGEVWRRR